MAMVIKTVTDILPLSEASIRRLEQIKSIKDEDIDTSDMPELTDDQLARMESVHFFDKNTSHIHA
jgi:hypothetical protein